MIQRSGCGGASGHPYLQQDLPIDASGALVTSGMPTRALPALDRLDPSCSGMKRLGWLAPASRVLLPSSLRVDALEPPTRRASSKLKTQPGQPAADFDKNPGEISNYSRTGPTRDTLICMATSAAKFELHTSLALHTTTSKSTDSTIHPSAHICDAIPSHHRSYRPSSLFETCLTREQREARAATPRWSPRSRSRSPRVPVSR